MRTVNLFGAALLALSTSAWSFGAVAQAPAPDTSAPAPADTSTPPAKKPVHHKKAATSKSKTEAAKPGDKAVDDLNAESLDAAKANKSFTPPAPPAPPAKPTKPVKAAHKKAPKKAPAPDAAPAAPADAPSK